MRISPRQSQGFGLAVSVVTGLAVFGVVWWFIAWQLDFWYIDEVLAPVAGIILGGLSGYWMFMARQREVPLNWVGVSLYLGKPTGTLYENGIHWICPFFGARNVPAKTEKFPLLVPGEIIDAQDGIAILFGMSDLPGKNNRLQYSVVDPTLYIAVDDPEDELREEYLQQARLFFGQMKMAIGVKNEKLLFGNYLELPPKSDITPDALRKHREFAMRLEKAKFMVTSTNPKEEPREEDLFTPESIITIMENAGDFMENATNWGIGKIIAFTPNVRENPEAEAAAAKKQEATEAMATLETRVTKAIDLTKKMKDTGVSADLSAALVAKIGGHDVKIENETVTYSGLPEVLRELGTLAINRLAKPQRRAPAKKRAVKSKGGK